MTEIVELPSPAWDHALPAPNDALAALERGDVLWFPQLRFDLTGAEHALLTSPLGAKAKNISFDPARDRVRGVEADAAQLRLLHSMMSRFARSASTLLAATVPHYQGRIRQARVSYRPAEIEGRVTSWRKDDTRLHVDSFPSSPTRGTRILRVFSNVNPHGQRRVWRLGEPFEAVARRFLPSLRRPWPGSAALMQWLHVTKARRSAYDHYMLGLHDAMKADLQYQQAVPQQVHEWPPGTTWICYTDQVSHAATRGQYLFEQTYHLDVAAMGDPAQSPLKTLERLLGRALV